MSSKYLNDSGLAYFWTKLKAWANSVFALIVHVHASSDVTLMSGYSKPASGSAISTSDSLNQAVGKLEAKVDAIDDSDYVHKTGNETVSGEKDFNNFCRFLNGIRIHVDTSSISDSFSKGGVPSNIVWDHSWICGDLPFYSFAAADIPAGLHRLLERRGFIDTSGVTGIECLVFNNTANASDCAVLGVYNDHGVAWAVAPTPSSLSDDSHKIATTEWVRDATGNTALTAAYAGYLTERAITASDYEMTNTDFQGIGCYRVDTFKANTLSAPAGNDGDYHLFGLGGSYNFRPFICITPRRESLFYGHFTSGTWNGWHEAATVDTSQTITGAKTLTTSLTFAPAMTRSVAPSADVEICQADIRDSANNRVSLTNFIYHTDKSSLATICAYNTTIASGNNIGYIGIGCNSSGNVYTVAPTPSSSDNSTNIATTAFVKNQNYITSDGFSAGLKIKGSLGSGYEMNVNDIDDVSLAIWSVTSFASNTTSVPPTGDVGDYAIIRLYTGSSNYANFLCASPRENRIFIGHFWGGSFNGWNELHVNSNNLVFRGNANSIFNDVDNATTYFCGATSRNNGGYLAIDGGSHSTGGAFGLHAKTNASTDKMLKGQPNGTLQWNGQNIQTTSDQRLKTKLSAIPDEVLDAWEDVVWGQFQYLEAVEEKGSSARLHSGMVSQQAQKAFSDRGLDACAYGFVCHELRDAVDEDRIVDERPAYVDGSGVRHDAETLTEHYHEDAVDLWMIRYVEALAMEAAYQRRENARLKRRIAGLEERLAALELRIS